MAGESCRTVVRGLGLPVGQEALDKVAAVAPDLILLDVMLPVLDGFTVCSILKAQAATQLIPIIIIIALDAVAGRVQRIKAGADHFLPNPCTRRICWLRSPRG